MSIMGLLSRIRSWHQQKQTKHITCDKYNTIKITSTSTPLSLVASTVTVISPPQHVHSSPSLSSIPSLPSPTHASHDDDMIWEQEEFAIHIRRNQERRCQIQAHDTTPTTSPKMNATTTSSPTSMIIQVINATSTSTTISPKMNATTTSTPTSMIIQAINATSTSSPTTCPKMTVTSSPTSMIIDVINATHTATAASTSTETETMEKKVETITSTSISPVASTSTSDIPITSTSPTLFPSSTSISPTLPPLSLPSSSFDTTLTSTSPVTSSSSSSSSPSATTTSTSPIDEKEDDNFPPYHPPLWSTAYHDEFCYTSMRDVDPQFSYIEHHGISRRVLIRMPSKLYTHDITCTSCTICLSSFHKGDTIRSLSCQHTFHMSCIDPWLSSHAKCPLCLSSVTPQMTDLC